MKFVICMRTPAYVRKFSISSGYRGFSTKKLSDISNKVLGALSNLTDEPEMIKPFETMQTIHHSDITTTRKHAGLRKRVIGLNKQAFYKGPVTPLILRLCNAEVDFPFDRASVVYDTSEQVLNPLIKTEDIFEEAKNKIASFSSDGCENLDRYAYQAMLCLGKFLEQEEKAYHEQCIQAGLRRGKNERDYQIVLAEHLFSRLVPGHKYNLNMKSQVVCPCGCGSVKECNAFSIGHEEVWHGEPDIQVSKFLIPVDVELTKDMMDEDMLDFDLDHVDDMANDTGVSFVEEETASRSLLSDYVYPQVVAQTIVHSFWAKKALGLSDCLVPSFCSNLKEVVVYMYDCDRDLLLRTWYSLPLWNQDRKPTLDVSTICFLWLCLNYTHFGPEISQDIYEELTLIGKQSRFHQLVGEKLDVYKNKIKLEHDQMKVSRAEDPMLGIDYYYI